MKGGFVLALAALLVPAHACIAASSVPDSWILEDIAKKTGTSPCFVRAALGEHLLVALQQYDASRTSRERIRQLIRRSHEALLAEQAAGRVPEAPLASCAAIQAT
ncbi:hypothetical protein [Luteimonas aquatica]|uniref:hypothetical protein n=1 Tax=Luteimonas aquatica TaxID=450364 RepID=UPI001F5913CB|nr:hypothetical protein [Luteimonas aquatica]